MRLSGWFFIVLALLSGAPAVAQTLPLTRETIDGAWVQQGQKCSDLQFVVVYLRDGRLYSGWTEKGPAGGGYYEITGRVLTDHQKPEPGYRSTSPALAKYNDVYLTERREAVRITKNRIDFDFPGNRNPDLTTPSFARCPEQPGFEPWFPKLRYGGFAPLRKFVPGSAAVASKVAPHSAAPIKAGDIIRASKPPAGWVLSASTCKETFTVCAQVLRRGTSYLVLQTVPINFRPGKGVEAERVVRVTRYAAAAGETSGWNCYVDGQMPALVFVPANRQTVRAVILDRSDNYVQLVVPLRQPNWCEFDAGD